MKCIFCQSDVDIFGSECYPENGMTIECQNCDFNKEITGRKEKLLNELAQACVRVYESIEDENEMNDEEYPDGDTNWEAIGTKKSRQAGIRSAY